VSKELLPHHAAWLKAHPDRSEAWLRARLADKFDVHHLDGDRRNNDAANVVLIESSDHMMLHSGARFLRLGWAERGRAMRRKDLEPKVYSSEEHKLADHFGVQVEQVREWQSKSRL